MAKIDTIVSYVDEAVYGANDGIVTTFAVVSGAAGATLGSDIILILGIANLIADGFSMGASSFLSIRTKRDIEHNRRWRLFRHLKPDYAFSRSLVTFVSFVCAGSIPLVPFIFNVSTAHMFTVSAVGSGITFFLVGGLRTLATRQGFLRSGLEMLIVGGIAAALAYGIGYGVQMVVG